MKAFFMRKNRLFTFFLCLGILCLSPSGSVRADLITFDDLATGDYAGGLTVSGVTFSDPFGGAVKIVLDLTDLSGSNQYLTEENLTSNLRFDFASPVSQFSFDYLGALSGPMFVTPSDSWAFQAFAADDSPLGSTQTIHAIDSYEFSSVGDISYAEIYVTDEIASDRLNIDNFNFTVAGTTPIPEPATMLLLGAGLIGLAGVRRKSKK